MFHSLSDYLQKYRAIVDKRESNKQEIKETIQKVLSGEIKDEDIKIQRGVIDLRAHPVIKNLLYQKKEEILRLMKKKGIENIHDIR
jgi:predicted transcriptional regulator